MNLREWSRSEINYGRRILNSGLEGARDGGETYLHVEPLVPMVCESMRSALNAAAAGACIGLLSGRQKPTRKVLALGILGGAVGFGVGVAWAGRHLGASVACGAWKRIGRVLDEHWLEKNPIDYA